MPNRLEKLFSVKNFPNGKIDKTKSTIKKNYKPVKGKIIIKRPGNCNTSAKVAPLDN